MDPDRPKVAYDALPMHFGMNLASAIGGEEFMGITLTAVVVDGDHAFFDAGALHGRSQAQQGIQFSRDKADVPEGQRVAMVFLGVRDTEPETAHYEGMIVCMLLIDRAAGTGWRDLTQEAMAMRRVLDGTVQLDDLTAGERIALQRALEEPLGGALWRNTDEARKAAVRGTMQGVSA
ncbi:MAG: YwhD family protein [Thermomicrobia bacterium]|nr:YwhD family protein [Thermomicrobia bacterium]